jgi:hypothetical protein
MDTITFLNGKTMKNKLRAILLKAKGKKIRCVLLILLFAAFTDVYSQVVIDLRTGIDDATQNPIAVGTFDDTWLVSPANTGLVNPYTSIYQSVKMGNGTYLNSNNVLTSYPLCNGVGWLSPNLHPTGYDVGGMANIGVYYYKMTFDLFSCNVQQAVLNIRCSFSQDIDRIKINNSTVWSASQSMTSTGNLNITLNNGVLNQGLNTIYISSWIVTGLSYPIGTAGMEIDGELKITTCASGDITIKDKHGNEKSQYCLDEDIFLSAGGSMPKGYTLILHADNGNGPSQICTVPMPGTPDGLNIKKLLESQYPIIFNTSTAYTVEVVFAPSCGAVKLWKEFSFHCCGPPKADFSLALRNDLLSGKSRTPGTHDWKVYPVSQYNGNVGPDLVAATAVSSGEFMPLGNWEFFDLEGAGGPCYYVSHTVTNDCGTACASQKLCDFNCDAKKCELEPIKNFNVNGDQLTWEVLPDATNYVIEVIPCDPTCCSVGAVSNDPGASPIHIVVPQQPGPIVSHVLSVTDFINANYEGVLTCYSVKVYGACPSGLSRPSTPVCVNTQMSSSCSLLGGRLAAAGSKELTGSSAGFSMDLFPNPASDEVSISIHTPEEGMVSISVLNNTGGIVKLFGNVLTSDKKAMVKWITGSLDKGLYLVKSQTVSGYTITKKLIIE